MYNCSRTIEPFNLLLSLFNLENKLTNSALNHFVSNEDYRIQRGYVLSNERIVSQKGKIIYLPVYYIMFIQNAPKKDDLIF